MNFVDITLKIIGIIAVLIVLWILWLYIRSYPSLMNISYTDTSYLSYQDEIPWKRIGESEVKPISNFISKSEMSNDEVNFKTLRVSAEQVGEARWKFRIRFVLINTLQETICIDDMHVRVYEVEVPLPPKGAVSYGGEMLLMGDNSIWKEVGRSYSLAPTDGYEIDLVLEMTRREGYPIYGIEMTETAGAVGTVFGALVDYYTIPEVKRKSLPSDCIYIFRYENGEGDLESMDNEKVMLLPKRTKKEMDASLRLETLLKDHLSFHPTPKS